MHRPSSEASASLSLTCQVSAGRRSSHAGAPIVSPRGAASVLPVEKRPRPPCSLVGREGVSHLARPSSRAPDAELRARAAQRGRDFRPLVTLSRKALMTFEIPVWFEVSSLIVLTLILIADLLIILKRPHIPSIREATLWVVFYVTLALIFAVILFWVTGSTDAMGQFIAGWLTEYSLSVDNLFVFVLIMAQFSVPRRYQQEV